MIPTKSNTGDEFSKLDLHRLVVSLVTRCLHLQTLEVLEQNKYPFKKKYFMGIVFCLYVCLCATCMPVDPRGQKRLSDLLDLE